MNGSSQAVKGGQMLGKFPARLAEFDSDVNIGRGRVLPTTPWEAAWNAVAHWIGVADADAIANVSRSLSFTACVCVCVLGCARALAHLRPTGPECGYTHPPLDTRRWPKCAIVVFYSSGFTARSQL